MANRRHPEVIAARVTETERGWIGAVAKSEGVPVATLVRSILLPAVKQRLADSLGTGPEPEVKERLAQSVSDGGSG